MNTKFKIDKFILFSVSLFCSFIYIGIFFNNLNNYYYKQNIEKEKIITFEKNKIENVFSTLDIYSNYIALRFETLIPIDKYVRYIQIQNLLCEINVLAGREGYEVNIYDQTNKKLFVGTSTYTLDSISNQNLKNILTTKNNPLIIENDNEIILSKQFFFFEDYLILLKIPSEKILSKNKNYSIFMRDYVNISNSNINIINFKHLKKSFIIEFSESFNFNIKYIFIYFFIPLIFTIVMGIFLNKIISFFFTKYLQNLLEKFQIEKVSGINIYLDDIYQEILKRNNFLLEKSRETEKLFNEKLMSDFILGILSSKEVEKKLPLESKVYCGILEVESLEQNLDDYLFSIKKLISKLESENLKVLLLEKEHIFLISKIPFIIDDLETSFNTFEEKYNFNIFGIISNEEIDFEILPDKKLALEKLLIYKNRIKNNNILEEKSLKELSFSYTYFYPINTEQKLIGKIQNFDLNGANEILKIIFENNFEQNNLTDDSIKRLKRIVINGLEKIIIHLEIKNISQEKDYFLERELLSNEDFINKTFSILKQIFEEYKSDNFIENSIENKMKTFIEDNYNREVSLIEFAEYMNFTPQYLSNIYKKTFGENFNISLNRYRIQKSIEIFIDNKGEIKIKDLGEMVGYTNTITFINNFKKFKNVTPTSFFEKYLKTKEKS